MYRIPDEELECPLCKAKALTAPTFFDNSEGYPQVVFDLRSPSKSWLAEKRRSFRVASARICMACGLVLPSLSAEMLAKLDEDLPELRPQPSPPPET